ncbi:tenascin-R-like [Amphiura filiformis]|uniref:tenascin-R-like n=1 Tax=Amphiura filiformis TaxID=82378 RepID=UPI003B2221F7
MGLLPSSDYTVTIETCSTENDPNGPGLITSTSNPPPPSDTCSTVSPGPCEIVVLGSTLNSISISWGDGGQNYINYQVSLDPQGVIQSNVQSRTATFSGLTPGARYTITVSLDPQGVIQSNVQSRTATFSGLTPGARYTITVLCLPASGDALANTQQYRTKPSPPTSLRASGATAVSILLTWNSAQNDLNSYDIFYSVGSTDTPILAGNVDGTVNTFRVTGLNPGTLYSFSVYAVAGSDQTGDLSVSTPAVTIGSTTTIPPGRIFVQFLANNEIGVVFGPINGVADYVISISPDDASNSFAVFNANTGYSHLFTPLQPNTVYTITVTSQSVGQGAGQQTYTTQVRTDPSCAGAIAIQACQTDSITQICICWEDAPDTNAGEQGFDYYIVYSTNPNGNTVEAGRVFYGEQPCQEIGSLFPDEQYLIEVDTVIDPQSPFPEQRCEGDANAEVGLTDPVPDNVIAVQRVTTNSIEILWAEIPDALGYFVSVWLVDAIQPNGIYQEAKPDATTAQGMLTGLMPGRLYNIAVRPVHGSMDDYPELMSITQRTIPPTPLPLLQTGSMASTITIAFNRPIGYLDYYLVYYTPNDGQPESPVRVEDTNQPLVMITNLLDDTDYNFRVVSVAGVGLGETTSEPSTATFTTAPAGQAEVIIQELAQILLNLAGEL